MLLVTITSILCVTFIFSQNTFESFYQNKSVLITGGCGFIGSHLAERLIELGAQVTIIDDLSSGNLKNIFAIQDRVTLVQQSITDMTACVEITKNKHVIFHLAAFISVPESIEKPEMCHKTNVDGTANLLEAARCNNVKRFVFSSSAAVYGPYEGICSEDIPSAPASPYGFSKLIGELLCKQYAHIFGLNTVVMRYFNVCGPRQNPNGAYAAVVAKFMHNMLHNLPITIFGDGLQTRDFVPVEKIVVANLFLGMCDADKIHGEVFNIATGKSVSLLEFVEQLTKQFPTYTAEINFAPERPGDIKHSAADCSKYFNLFNNRNLS